MKEKLEIKTHRQFKVFIKIKEKNLIKIDEFKDNNAVISYQNNDNHG